MVRTSPILASDRGFDPRLEYETVSKLVASFYPLIGLQNVKD